MKILNKSTITRRMDEACFFEERDVMVQVKSPFIVNLNYAFQDELNLYIIMDFLPGGDLWQMLINTAEEWTEEWTRFYMAELLVALEDLHKTGYMHRDVKPENIMIDANGHFKLTDFGSSAKIPLKGFLDANTVAVGTPCYVAPEILKAEEYSESVDIFSFGCVLFETIMGSSPFESEENGSIFESNEKTKKIEYYFPPPDDELKYSPEFADLVKKLLVEKEKRLTIGQIKDHPFFSSIDWSKIRNMEITPPYKPTLKSNFDTTYFNDVDGEARAEGFTATPEFSVDHLPFVGFTYDKRHFTESKGKEKVRLAGNESEFVKTLQLELEEMKTKLTLADSAAKKEKQTLLEQIESLSSAEAELKSLECKYRAANRKLERLEQARKNSIQKQMEESKEVEKNYKRYETELRTTTSKLKQVTEELQQREASIKVLENQLLQQQTNRNVLNEKEMLELTSRLESLSLEKENIRAENHNLLKINTTLKEEMDAANEKMTSLTREIKKNKEVLDSIDQKYQTLQQDFHMLQAEKTKLLEDLCQRDEELKIKVKNLEDSRTFIDELNEMNSSLRQTLVQLTSELELSKTRKHIFFINFDEYYISLLLLIFFSL
ncbi:serine/threonine-protein kinase MRCK alpha-like [Zophobas morio]|uniref:serine/threonine-protein kinase MRCK alpha-like n=1 Tax=Zophobas morio TaxID=2755281 RepID=UPI003082B65D